jgi:type IV secretion system protein VirD4
MLTNRENIIVYDPAGQACAVTSRYRREIGHRVVIFDAFNALPGRLGESASISPLWELNPERETFEGDIRAIAMTLLPVDPGEKQKHFSESAQDMIAAVAMHIRVTEGEKATLPRVNQVLHLGPFELNKFFEAMQNSPFEASRQVGMTYHLQKPTDARDSVQDVLDTARRATKFLADRAMLKLFSGSVETNFSFRDLKDPAKPTTVYIVWPANRGKTYAKASDLLISSAINTLMDYPSEPRCLVIVDEMPTALQKNGGGVEKIKDMFTNGRKYGARVQVVGQDWSQFLTMFPNEKDASTLLASAGMAQFFGAGAMDKQTQALLCEQAGTLTIWRPSQNKPVIVSTEHHAELIGWDEAQSGPMGIPLLRPADLREMHGNGGQIVFLMGGRFPVIMPRFPHYFQIPALAARADPDPYESGSKRAF